MKAGQAYLSLGKNITLYLIAGCFLALASCTSSKQITYFQGTNDGVIKSKIASLEPVVQKNDLLSITVSSLNPEATIIFNAPNESTPNTNSATAGSNNTLTVGYLVNQNGEINFPILGAIKVDGMTKSQVGDYLVKQLVSRKLLIDPIVTIRFLNFRVSVLGEVGRPGVYTVPNEKLSLLEALGLAGDITIFGKRTDVLVLREKDNGDKILHRVNLNNADIFTSPYYYLQSNDIVYVSPSKNRVTRENAGQWAPIAISLISFMIIIMDRTNIF